MAQILIRNIDEQALDKMRERAQRNARSLEAELRMLIEDEAARERNREGFWERADAIRNRLAATGVTFSDSGQLRKIGRPGDE